MGANSPGSLMKINAYKVVQRGEATLPQLLHHLSGLDHEHRAAEVQGSTMKLEEVQVDQHGVWRLDFTKFRLYGPGRASLSRPIAAFELEEDESFGEETAAVFWPKTGYMMIQYNHHGPRFAAIESYFHQFSIALRAQQAAAPAAESTGFGVVPVLRPDSAVRLERMRILSKIEFTVFVPGALAMESQTRPSLNSLLDNTVVQSAQNVTIEVSAGRNRGAALVLEPAKQLINDLLGVRDEVSQLRVTGQQDEDAPREPIDLLEARLQADIPLVRGPDHRYGRAERWAALDQAYDAWIGSGHLPT